MMKIINAMSHMDKIIDWRRSISFPVEFLSKEHEIPRLASHFLG